MSAPARLALFAAALAAVFGASFALGAASDGAQGDPPVTTTTLADHTDHGGDHAATTAP